MPIVRIEMLEGRPPEMKKALMEKVTAAVIESLGVKAEQVRVIVYDIPPEHWSVGGVQSKPPVIPGKGPDLQKA